LFCALVVIIGGGLAVAECWDGPALFERGPGTSGVNAIPPDAPVAEIAFIVRGQDLSPGTFCAMPIDGELGFAQVHLVHLADDVTPPEAMGVRLVPLNNESTLAADMNFGYDFRADRVPKLCKHLWGCDPAPDVSVRDESGYWFVMCWMDGHGANRRAISEKFLIYAIDGSGNVSVAADTLVIKDPGRAK
jgi:hypothetical protein